MCTFDWNLCVRFASMPFAIRRSVCEHSDMQSYEMRERERERQIAFLFKIDEPFPTWHRTPTPYIFIFAILRQFECNLPRLNNQRIADLKYNMSNWKYIIDAVRHLRTSAYRHFTSTLPHNVTFSIPFSARFPLQSEAIFYPAIDLIAPHDIRAIHQYLPPTP